MMKKKLFVVLMAGGKGERFWPRSREQTPKQFLSVSGRLTLVQATVSRIKKIVSSENILVIVGKKQKKAALAQLKDIPRGNIIAEPVGRNTAPCAALAAAIVYRRQKDAIIVMLPADSHIENEKLYLKTISKAAEFAYSEKKLLTIGISPTYPSTGYGYILPGKLLTGKTGIKIFETKRFIEKPDLKTARKYVRKGMKWNSGMFVWRADVFLEEFKKYAPQYNKAVNSFLKFKGSIEKVLSRVYPGLVKDSIDYVLMEKSKNIAVVEGNFTWDDLGGWRSILRFMKCDKNANYVKGDVFLNSCSGCLAISDCGALGLSDMKDIIAVKTSDAVMICPIDKSENVKKVVQLIGKKGKKHYL
ncbi:MAG: mannose-1-phosphate guanylyltransferase [Candidatus Aureabacteria bacterium]|nr:mannose-1-phosphate guanylyltransferase [Candidatus Auribacterota bacterium]